MSGASLEIGPELAGATLAKVVRELLEVPWSRARTLCERGAVQVDGVQVRDHAARVSLGAKVQVDPQAPKPRREAGGFDPNRIVFVDRDVVVVDKPPGLQSVPFYPDDHDSVVQHVGVALGRLENRRLPPLRVVQRLDKDTTGLMVFARTREAEQGLAQQFRRHSVHRRYLGLAHGAAIAARFESLLVPDRGDGIRGSWRDRGGRPPNAGRAAVTFVEPLERIEPAARHFESGRIGVLTWVECRLETGRTHQIRIHLAEAGHPLVGEAVYIRDYAGPRLRVAASHLDRPILHAAELGFFHPRHGGALSWSAAVPEDVAGWLEVLRGGSGPGPTS